MSTKIQFLLLVALISFHSIGCKTAEKLAFWKSSENAQTESEVLARSAPELPSQIAKQAEALAATGVSITPNTASGGVAAPYTPSISSPPPTTLANAAPSISYPSTGVEGYPPATAQAQQTANPSSSNSDNLGSIAMPYNPNSVPAPPAATPAPSPTVTPTDRYASSTPTVTTESLASPNSKANSPTVPAYTPSYDRYASAASAPSTSTAPVQHASASQTPDAPAYGANSNTLSDRYGNTKQTGGAPGIAQTAPITPTPSAAPYRPGGTSDYPGQNAMEVAARPSVGSSNSETPAYGTGGQDAFPQTPQYR